MRKLITILLIMSLLLCACGEPEFSADSAQSVSAPDVSAYELAEYIITATGRSMDSVVFVNASYSTESLAGYIEGYYGLASEALSDGAIFRSAAADEAYEVSVFKLTEKADISSVFNELEEYRRGRQGDFFGYNPEQADIVDSAMVSLSADGLWAGVFICEDPVIADEAFFTRLGMDYSEYAEPEIAERETQYHTELGELPDYWLPYTDPEIDDMTLWDNSALVAAIKSGDNSGLDAHEKKLFKKVNKVIEKVIDADMTALEKEEAVYRWITENCEYDFRHYEVPNAAPRESYEPYGAIVEGKAVCLGFATAFQLFMDVLDIECITVVGAAFESMEDHAWNMVKIDGEWYCCDPTWDAGAYGFGHFNVSSDYMAMTGRQWDYEAYPIAQP